MQKVRVTMSDSLKLKGEKYECFPLDWDTDYFKIKSARVILKGIISKEEQENILEYCKQFQFVTISNVGNLKENNHWIGNKAKAFLTDMNIQFTKKITEEPDFSDELSEIYKSYLRDGKVVSIAKSAFHYSRFFNDPDLPKEKAENIYLHWTECAFGQAGKYFVIAKRNGEVAGYILFSINKLGNSATIELIAVDEKFRGQKVGKSLVSRMESFMHTNGIEKINVGTQVDNITATNFYIASGFQYVSCSSVYHLWMDELYR
jgi:dTDP-4-amino-4,6-dideoxy-D-galactose acyltransferase